MIELAGVGLKRAGRALFQDFNLMLLDPGLHAITGPTGSGKTLLAHMLCGHLRPQTGQVRVDGTNLYRLLALNRPPLWFCDALAEIPGGQSAEEYLRGSLYDAGGRPRELDPIMPRIFQTLGLDPAAYLEELSRGQLAALQLVLAALVPLRAVVLDGHLSLLDSTTAAVCMALFAELRRNLDCFVILLAAQINIEIPGLQSVSQLAGSLPVTLALPQQSDFLAGDAGSAPRTTSVVRITLQGGRDPRRAYQSGTNYRILGLLERGLRLELVGTIGAVLAELEADGLALRAIEWE